MIDIATLSVGDKVHYQPDYYVDRWQNGIVKEIRKSMTDSVGVVYHCDNDWANYQNYTSALTDLRNLKLGWKR